MFLMSQRKDRDVGILICAIAMAHVLWSRSCKCTHMVETRDGMMIAACRRLITILRRACAPLVLLASTSPVAAWVPDCDPTQFLPHNPLVIGLDNGVFTCFMKQPSLLEMPSRRKYLDVENGPCSSLLAEYTKSYEPPGAGDHPFMTLHDAICEMQFLEMNASLFRGILNRPK